LIFKVQVAVQVFVEVSDFDFNLGKIGTNCSKRALKSPDIKECFKTLFIRNQTNFLLKKLPNYILHPVGLIEQKLLFQRVILKALSLASLPIRLVTATPDTENFLRAVTNASLG